VFTEFFRVKEEIVFSSTKVVSRGRNELLKDEFSKSRVLIIYFTARVVFFTTRAKRSFYGHS
jgi:hypothetical protein